MRTKIRRRHVATDISVNLALLLAVGVMGWGYSSLEPQIKEAFVFWYERVGLVMVGLLPLTALLVGVVLYVALARQPRTRRVQVALNVIAVASPLLGFLGTVLGVAEGASHFTLAKGVTDLLEAVEKLMAGVSISLLSTAWGTVLALPAVVLEIVMFPEISDEAAEIGSTSASKPQQTKT